MPPVRWLTDLRTRHLLKPMSVRLRQVSALEAVLVAAAPRPPSNEDSPPAAGLWLGGLRRSFVTGLCVRFLCALCVFLRSILLCAFCLHAIGRSQGLAQVSQLLVPMGHHTTIAELQRAGIVIRASEAIAIVQKLINERPIAPPHPPYAPPS